MRLPVRVRSVLKSDPCSFNTAVKVTHTTQHFKACNTVVFSVFTVLCVHTTGWFQNIPSPQKETLNPIPAPPPSPWQPLMYVPSLRVGPFWAFPAHGLSRCAAVGLAARAGRLWAVAASGFMPC